MIPKNIDRKAILAAIQYIDEDGIPKARLSRTYNLKHNGKLYPPKYLISIANQIVNGNELEPFMFGGGAETNGFLEKMGFEIVPCSNETVTCHTEQHDEMEIVTVVVGNQTGNCPDNSVRFSFMEDVVRENHTADIILFPAGYIYFDHQRTTQINKLCNHISTFLKSIECRATVCIGIDCDDGNDQLAVAVSKEGTQAIGRKFHPTADEDGYIREAKTYNELEMGYPRVFNVKNKSVYLAICYDGFGIRHCNLPDMGIDVVLVLAHQFWKRGEGPSGDVDFARKGFAGASQHWNCPVFGTAVFFCRDIPENWPTGVLWTDRSKSVRHFKYHENQLTWNEKKALEGDYEEALCYKYILPL
jgi:hypothetical protein